MVNFFDEDVIPEGLVDVYVEVLKVGSTSLLVTDGGSNVTLSFLSLKGGSELGPESEVGDAGSVWLDEELALKKGLI